MIEYTDKRPDEKLEDELRETMLSRQDTESEKAEDELMQIVEATNRRGALRDRRVMQAAESLDEEAADAIMEAEMERYARQYGMSGYTRDEAKIKEAKSLTATDRDRIERKNLNSLAKGDL